MIPCLDFEIGFGQGGALSRRQYHFQLLLCRADDCVPSARMRKLSFSIESDYLFYGGSEPLFKFASVLR